MLQAYALAKYLQSLGHDVALIDYRPQYQPGHKVDPSFTMGIGFWGLYGIRHLYRLYKKVQAPRRRAYYELEQARRDAFEQFFREYIPLTHEQYNSVKQLVANPPEADLYIAGSDQIWNTNLKNGRDAAYYLGFGSPKRKISYAASFATQELNGRFKGFVRRQLSNFDSISVREQSGVSILESLGYSGVTVVDPVFLLQRHEWDATLNEFDDGVDSEYEDYVLTYDFELVVSVIAPIAKRLSSLLGCKIYSVGPKNHEYADKSFVCCSPLKFLSLIKHARCVISNSFHGTAFSMIYDKDFFVVKRKDGLNSRMQDLLGCYGLSDRLIEECADRNDLGKHIDYSLVKPLLDQDIDKSKTFLQQQINAVNNRL